jgi:hypothetical protein
MRSLKFGAALAGVTLFLMISASGLKAQVANGSILGTATDTSGAVLASTNITCTSVETGVVRTAVTDGTGAYTFPALPVGTYNLEGSLQGFRTEVRNGVAVTVGASVAVNFTLAVGSTEQKVEVTAEAPQVNTTDASVGGLVSETAIRELPLNGRDWLQLATLQAGVVGGSMEQQSPTQATNSRAARGNGEALAIDGNRPTENVFTMDNLVVNDYANASPGSGLGINLGVDGIREFRVLTEEYTAEYGMTSGGVVNAVYKSGTNQFHWGLFEFLRNSALDARNFFDYPTIPPFRRNQFGADVGGPIKKDKTFFFVNYEGLREVQSLSISADTLSLNARQGILTEGTFPISPVIQPYLALFPLPNGAVNGDSAKFNFGAPLNGSEDYGVVKLDHYFTDRTTISGSFQMDNANIAEPDAFDEKFIGSPSRHYNGVVNFQHIFSPSLLNNARVGLSRTNADDSFDTSAINPVVNDTSLGFIPGAPAGIITVSGLTGFAGGMGASGADIYHYTSFQGGDDVTWTKGRHTLKFGAMVDHIRSNIDSVNTPLGAFDFPSIQDLILGIPDNYQIDSPGTSRIRGFRDTYAGVYAEDEIALRRNLKLNVGLRYEYVTPITEAFGRVAILPTLDAPGPKLGGSFFHPSEKNFAPRLGIAWDPTGSGKTAVRAGYGIYDVLPLPYLLNSGFEVPPFSQGGEIAGNPALPASLFPTAANALSLAPTSSSAAYIQQYPPVSYNQQWNLTIQRQLSANGALTVGYLGSRSVDLPRAIDDFNLVPPSLTTIAPDGLLAFPCAPIVAGACTAVPAVINPNVGKIRGTVWDNTANYNAFVTAFSQRFSHGVSFEVAYTWSKAIDEGSNTLQEGENNNSTNNPYPFFPQMNKGPSEFDITHHLVFNFTWDLPSPHSANAIVKGAFAGWELGGIFTAQTGPPFSVLIHPIQSNDGSVQTDAERPNFVPGPGCSTNATNPGQPLNYINLQCFSFPAPGEMGNVGRNSLRAPGLLDFDPSLFKNWTFVQEKMKLQFRAEFFNVLNRTNFEQGIVTVLDGNGNQIPTAAQLAPPTATTSRQIQFGLKLNW